MNDTIAALRANLTARQATRLDAIRGRYDGWLIAVASALACLGMVMVGSAGLGMMDRFEVGPTYFLTRQILFLGLGAALAYAIMRTELKWVEQYNQVLLLACFLLLPLVLVPGLGTSVNGARRWLNLGLLSFQPVEAVKLLLIVWLSSYLARFRDEVHASWRAMIKALGVAGLLVAMLLVVHKDFGSSALILSIVAGMMVLGGANLPRMMVPVAVALPALAMMILLEPYRMQRLVSYRDPWVDPFGAGYQLTNALMAVGRGEWFGVGLGASVQKLSYLPEAHTDFIMAVIAEELGFVGVLTVIALYTVLVARALWIGAQCVGMRRHFAGYCAFGIALWIGLQSFVSIGVNLGLLPTKGLTLPLISYGGSSVLMTCAAVGLLLRVSYELDRARRQVARLRGAGEGAPAVAGQKPVSTPAAAPFGVRGKVAPLTRPAETVRTTAEPARGTSRLRDRIEPTFGRLA